MMTLGDKMLLFVMGAFLFSSLIEAALAIGWK